MIRELTLLVNDSKGKLHSKVRGIVINPEDLAVLREEMDIDLLDELNSFLGYAVLVLEKTKTFVLNEYKEGRYYKVSSKGIEFIRESGKSRYTKLLENSKK